MSGSTNPLQQQAEAGLVEGSAGDVRSWDLMAGRDFTEVRFGGSGGQGILLMGMILATAATMDRRRVVQTESYGPEARGGYSRSDIIISNEAVDYPEVEEADLLVAISQAAATQYIASLREDGIFIYDSEKVKNPPAFKGITFAIPFTSMAVEETGRQQTSNILALGAVVAITGVVSIEALRLAVVGKVPPGTEELNGRALARGLAIDPSEWQLSGAGGRPSSTACL